MAIGTIVLDDFSGGFRAAEASPDFGESEWGRLFGVVLSGDRTLAAQWALSTLEELPVTSWQVFDGVAVYRVETAGGPVWYGGGLPFDEQPFPLLDAPSFTETTLILDDSARGELGTFVLGAQPSQEGDD